MFCLYGPILFSFVARLWRSSTTNREGSRCFEAKHAACLGRGRKLRRLRQHLDGAQLRRDLIILTIPALLANANCMDVTRGGVMIAERLLLAIDFNGAIRDLYSIPSGILVIGHE